MLLADVYALQQEPGIMQLKKPKILLKHACNLQHSSLNTACVKHVYAGDQPTFDSPSQMMACASVATGSSSLRLIKSCRTVM